VAFPVFFWSSCPPIKPLRLGLGLFAEVWTWFLLAESYGHWASHVKHVALVPEDYRESPKILCLGPSGSKPKSPWSLSEKSKDVLEQFPTTYKVRIPNDTWVWYGLRWDYMEFKADLW
jgi:hypothetical protein